jgi:anti-sigma regulatory factor (Ser/Thr protein kinase)
VSADTPAAGGSEVVHLDVPAISGRLRLIRLAVVGLATEYGADVDDLEDVRIATGEICTHLVNQASPQDRLCVDIRVSGAHESHESVAVDVHARVDGLGEVGPLDELSDMVLATTASEHGVRADGSATVSWFRRELSVTSPAASEGDLRGDA